MISKINSLGNAEHGESPVLHVGWLAAVEKTGQAKVHNNNTTCFCHKPASSQISENKLFLGIL